MDKGLKIVSFPTFSPFPLQTLLIWLWLDHSTKVMSKTPLTTLLNLVTPTSDFILRASGCHLCDVTCCVHYATPSLPPLPPFHPDAYQTCPLWCLTGAINLNDKIEHWIPSSLMLFGYRQPDDSHHWDLSQHQLSLVPNNHLKTGWKDDIYFANPQREQASDGYNSASAGVARRLVAGTTHAPARVW